MPCLFFEIGELIVLSSFLYKRLTMSNTGWDIFLLRWDLLVTRQRGMKVEQVQHLGRGVDLRIHASLPWYWPIALFFLKKNISTSSISCMFIFSGSSCVNTSVSLQRPSRGGLEWTLRRSLGGLLLTSKSWLPNCWQHWGARKERRLQRRALMRWRLMCRLLSLRVR